MGRPRWPVPTFHLLRARNILLQHDRAELWPGRGGVRETAGGLGE
jgi:hypothetical protein